MKAKPVKRKAGNNAVHTSREMLAEIAVVNSPVQYIFRAKDRVEQELDEGYL